MGKKSCPLVHSMHGSSGLPDELKSHAIGHPWSSLVSVSREHQLVAGLVHTQHAKRITVQLLLSRRSVVRLLTTVGLPRLQRLGPNSHPRSYSVDHPPTVARTWSARLRRWYNLLPIVGRRPSCPLEWFQASQTFVRRCWSDRTIEFLPDTARPTKFEASPPHASKLSLEISGRVDASTS